MIICIPLPVMKVGGPSTFVQSFRRVLEQRGFRVEAHPAQKHDILFILSSLPFSLLRQSKQQGSKIVQRLDSVYYYRVRGVLYPLWNFRMKIIHQFFADHVVYQGENCKYVCNKFLGPSRAPWTIIPNGTDLSRYTPHGAQKNLRDRPEQKIILSVGVFRRPEMILPILCAVELLHRKDPQYKLVIIGPVTSKIARVIARFRTHPGIHFVGSVSNDELPAYERSADVYAFSDVACSPNVLMEALGSGLPVVAFDRGGISELINAACGAVVPHTRNEFWKLRKFDVPAFARGLESTMQRLSALHKQARKRAEEQCSLDQMVDRYEEVFQKVL